MSLADWVPSAPETTPSVRLWFIVVFVGYVLARKGLARFRGRIVPSDMGRLSDAATFAGSLLLLIGVVNPGTLRAIGDTTVFLVIAGVGGLFHSGEQMFEEW